MKRDLSQGNARKIFSPKDYHRGAESWGDYSNQELTEDAPADFAADLATLLQKHPDLQHILDTWEILPEHNKHAIMALVQSHLEKRLDFIWTGNILLASFP